MHTKITFQYVTIGVAVFLAILGVLGFAGIIPLPKGSSGAKNADITGSIVIWGTEPASVFNAALSTFVQKSRSQFRVTYFEDSPATFDADITEAIASGQSPDAILLPQDLMVRYKDKLYDIPPTVYTARAYQDTFVDEGDLFLTKKGILAIPLLIDPMVLYVNRDLIATAGIAQIPKTWEDFYTLAPTLSKYDQALAISQSEVALGEYRNVTHAKDILALLTIQAGNPIVTSENDLYASTYAQSYNLSTSPAVSALQFFTSFSDPASAAYSWNRSLPESKYQFLAGNLVFYLGYASEASELQEKNPHLNFSIAPMPQPKNARIAMTLGRLQGLALLKTSIHLGSAYAIIARLAEPDAVQVFTDTSGLPPARRDMLGNKPTDARQSVFYDSALISRAWPDPNPLETDIIFQTAIEDITSGRFSASDAVHQVDTQLEYLTRIANGSSH